MSADYLTFCSDKRAKVERKHLDQLDATKVYSDSVFLDLRNLSHDFQRTLNGIFFEADTPLREFIIQYGVF